MVRNTAADRVRVGAGNQGEQVAGEVDSATLMADALEAPSAPPGRAHRARERDWDAVMYEKLSVAALIEILGRFPPDARVQLHWHSPGSHNHVLSRTITVAPGKARADSADACGRVIAVLIGGEDDVFPTEPSGPRSSRDET
jgi:hypothetical protein